MIKFGCHSLPWFKQFLAISKTVSAFCRDYGNDFHIALLKVDVGATNTWKQLKFFYFAAWRWSKLGRTCKGVSKALIIMAKHQGVVFVRLKRSQDKVLKRHVHLAVEREEWHTQLRCITWFSEITTGGLEWIGSCACHEDLFKLKIKYDCLEKGRWLPWAYQRADLILSTLLHESAQEWSVPLSLVMLTQMRGMSSAVYARGLDKLDWIQRIPYAISRIGLIQCAREYCINQFALLPLAEHNRVAIEFLAPGSRNLALIQGMPDDFQVPGELTLPLESLQKANMDDSLAEKPHAELSRESHRCRAARHAWSASTVRLAHNLEDCYSINALTGVSLQQTFDEFKRVVQTSRHKREPRMTKAAFIERFYYCMDAFEPSGVGSDVAPKISPYRNLTNTPT